MKKTRYTLMKGEEVLGTASNLKEVASLAGCTRAQIYAYLTPEGTFTFRKITYKIIDKLA